MSERDYRKLAQGQPCTLLLAPKCAGRETTVFAHAPCEDKGMGFKSPHWWGAFACFNCHGLIDGQLKLGGDIMAVEKLRAWMRGIYRTRKIVHQLLNKEN